MIRSTRLATITFKLSQSRIRGKDALHRCGAFALLAVKRHEGAAVRPGYGNVDSVSATECTVGGKLRSRLRQRVVQGDELDRMQIAEQIDRESRPDRISEATTQGSSDLCQDKVWQHNSRAALILMFGS